MYTRRDKNEIFDFSIDESMSLACSNRILRFIANADRLQVIAWILMRISLQIWLYVHLTRYYIVLQTQLHGRRDKVLQVFKKIVEIWANGFWICHLADDFSIYSTAEGIQKLSKQKTYVTYMCAVIIKYIYTYILKTDLCDLYLINIIHMKGETCINLQRFCRNKITICKRRSCILGASYILPLYINHWFCHSIGLTVLPICKTAILHGLYRLRGRWIINSNDILVRHARHNIFEAILLMKFNITHTYMYKFQH